MTDRELLIRMSHDAKRYGLTVWQWKPGKVGHHSANSLHNQVFPGTKTGRAFDAYGPWWKMVRFVWHVRRVHGKRVKEAIFNGGNSKFSISRKNGKHVSPSFWGQQTWLAHKGHVHIGM